MTSRNTAKCRYHGIFETVYYRRAFLLPRSPIFDTFVSPAKTSEPLEMPFAMLTRVGPRSQVLDAGANLTGEWAILGVDRPIRKH